MADELDRAGVDPDDHQGRAMALAVMRWCRRWRRPDHPRINELDVPDAITNAFGMTRDELDLVTKKGEDG